jgi:hypothetical protein
MRRIVGLAIVSLLAAACSGSGGGSASSSPSIVASPSSSAPASASTAAEATKPAPTPIPGCLPGCVRPDLIRPGALPAGDYTTKHFFGEQLTVTVPAGWTSFEDSTGEFGLRPSSTEAAKLMFWLDVYPIVGGTSQKVDGFDGTAASLVDWIEHNPNVKVTKKGEGKIGDLDATVLELALAPNATNDDPGCPAEIQPCVSLVSFPQWDGFYGVAGPFHVRIVAADASWGGESHAVYAVIDADTDDAFAGLAPAATEMIEGARLPLGVEQEG